VKKVSILGHIDIHEAKRYQSSIGCCCHMANALKDSWKDA